MAQGQDNNRVKTRVALLELLPFGRANALKGRAIADCLKSKGFELPKTDPAREVRQLIHELRSVGVPVCADTDGANGGFYLPERPDQLDEYLGRDAHRIKEQLHKFSQMKATLDQWRQYASGQTTMEEEDPLFAHIPKEYREVLIRRLAELAPTQTPKQDCDQFFSEQTAHLVREVASKTALAPTFEEWVRRVHTELVFRLRKEGVLLPINHLRSLGVNEETLARFLKPIWLQKNQTKQEVLIDAK